MALLAFRALLSDSGNKKEVNSDFVAYRNYRKLLMKKANYIRSNAG
jgi:hypothetical protein